SIVGHKVVIATDQLGDSDFFNNAFAGLWGSVAGTRSTLLRARGTRPKAHGHQATLAASRGRTDLTTIAGGGSKLVRLYTCGPERGWDGKSGRGHVSLLNKVSSLGMKLTVPVSNYFLTDKAGTWNGKVPDSNFSWTSAPPSIRKALIDFVSSITV